MPHNHERNDSVFALSKHQGLCFKHRNTHTHILMGTCREHWDDDGWEEITGQRYGVYLVICINKVHKHSRTTLKSYIGTINKIQMFTTWAPSCWQW